ncbi:MAG: hypothetical protein OEX81_04850 [Candidatus Pacebacteria bacterium]|nr:hypothetical protein [Candidatus Paceibacterota bacterium]
MTTLDNISLNKIENFISNKDILKNKSKEILMKLLLVILFLSVTSTAFGQELSDDTNSGQDSNVYLVSSLYFLEEFNELDTNEIIEARYDLIDENGHFQPFDQHNFPEPMPGDLNSSYSDGGCTIFAFTHALMILQEEPLDPLEMGRTYFPESAFAIPTRVAVDRLRSLDYQVEPLNSQDIASQESITRILQEEYTLIIAGLDDPAYPTGHIVVLVLDNTSEEPSFVALDSDGGVINRNINPRDISEAYGVKSGE